MKHSTTAADGATPENEDVAGEPGIRPEEAKAASGTVSALQEKMDRWTDRVGYGANRGLVCGLFTAWGLAVVSWFFKIAQAVLTHSYGKHDTDTLGESLTGLLVLTFGLSIFFAPIGVIVGAFLGAAGIIRNKKHSPEPPSSKPGP